LREWLAERDVLHPVVPVVPHISKFKRYEDVKLWFERYGEAGHDPGDVSFVVLDDDQSQGLELLGERFHRVEPEEGLTEDDIDAVIELLRRTR